MYHGNRGTEQKLLMPPALMSGASVAEKRTWERELRVK